MVKEEGIKINQVFWSIDNLKFADDILFSILHLERKTVAPKFRIYEMSDGITIIAFDEKDAEIRLHDTSLNFVASKGFIKDAFQKIKKMNYHCYLTEDKLASTLSCFAPAPHRYCEIVIHAH